MNSEYAKPFTDMAARIEAIDREEFAGAVVIVPPSDSGEPIIVLTSDPSKHPIQFWSGLKSRVDVATTEVMEQARNRQQGQWGAR